MGQNFVNCEKISGGQIAKICNNLALAIQMMSIVEANLLGKKLGINMDILNQIMKVNCQFYYY